jgi:low temperature requirement protein LtrA
VLVAALGLALSAALWWAYFGGDDERAERALAATEPEQRPRRAVNAFGYAHIPLLLGIVMIAAAEEKATGHAFDALDLDYAIGLSGGLAVYLAGEVAFRRSLGIGQGGLRLAAAAAALAAIPLGTEVAAVAQLAAVVALMAALFSVEGRRPRLPEARLASS